MIANGGFLVHPHVVLNEQEPGSEKIERERPKPVRVLKPQTAFTMQQLMERVTLPGGTGPRAHVLGYTTAGKTGTAQIFDVAHHVYTHRYNASFLGFAPVANPAIVVVVTVSGTTAFGATAAAPAFKTVMGEALRLLGVPRDLPAEIERSAGEQSPAKRTGRRSGYRRCHRPADARRASARSRRSIR